MKLLILCGTHGGHTVRIADRLVDVALAQEHRVQVMDCAKLPPDFSTRFFDALVIGSPVHFGKHHAATRRNPPRPKPKRPSCSRLSRCWGTSRPFC
jgi:menaquinone-dependent protoporphyrinogen oxidase